MSDFNGKHPKIAARESWEAMVADGTDKHRGYPEPTEDLYQKLGGKLINGVPSLRGRTTQAPVIGGLYLRPSYDKAHKRQERLGVFRYEYLIPVLVTPGRVYCKSLEEYGGNGWISSFDMDGVAWRASVSVPLALRKDPEVDRRRFEELARAEFDASQDDKELSLGDRLSVRLMTLSLGDLVTGQGELKDDMATIKKELSEIHQMLYDIHFELGLRGKPSHYKRESET